MPFTPYHFGPSGFFGLVFGKWIDLPVFVLANVIVDVEVLVIGALGLGWPIHRYCHTLLIGVVVGALWGIAAYPLRHFFKKIMRVFYIPYKTSLIKMVISGILGIWLHVLIDGIYHTDVRIFWPSKNMWFQQTLRKHITKAGIETVCLLFCIAAFILYILLVTVFRRNWVRDNE
jgi:membrane-bound metal-dependent hydrolase YbcI (DUF457 family)